MFQTAPRFHSTWISFTFQPPMNCWNFYFNTNPKATHVLHKLPLVWADIANGMKACTGSNWNQHSLWHIAEVYAGGAACATWCEMFCSCTPKRMVFLTQSESSTRTSLGLSAQSRCLWWASWLHISHSYQPFRVTDGINNDLINFIVSL